MFLNSKKILILLIIGLVCSKTSLSGGVGNLDSMSGAIQGWMQGIREGEERQRQIDDSNAKAEQLRREINQTNNQMEDIRRQIENDRRKQNIAKEYASDSEKTRNLLIPMYQKVSSGFIAKPIKESCEELKNNPQNISKTSSIWDKNFSNFIDLKEPLRENFDKLISRIYGIQSRMTRDSNNYSNNIIEITKIQQLGIFANELRKIQYEDEKQILGTLTCFSEIKSKLIKKEWIENINFAINNYLTSEVKIHHGLIEDSLIRYGY